MRPTSTSAPASSFPWETGKFSRVEGPRGFATWEEAEEAGSWGTRDVRVTTLMWLRESENEPQARGAC